MDMLIAQLGVALAIGLLVGLGDGWRPRGAPDRSRQPASVHSASQGFVAALVKQSTSAETVGHAVLAALMANGIGRLSLAVFAAPARLWLSLAGLTLIAAAAGYRAMQLL